MVKFIILILVSIGAFSCVQSEGNEKERNTSHLTSIGKQITDIERFPDSFGLRMRLINSYDSMGMYKEAISQTDSLIKRDSFNNGLWFTKGQLQEESGDTTGAINSYTRALRIYPSLESQLHLANLYAETKDSKALIICENVRKSGMGREIDGDCYFIAAVYYARIGSTETALKLFDKAINENYTLMEAHMEKGFIYYDNKNYRKALKIFETAITVNNTYADAYYWVAKCEEALGKKTEAVLNYKRSLGLDKQLKEAAEAIERLE